MPLSGAVLAKLYVNKDSCDHKSGSRQMVAAAIDLSIAYAASLGGMATLTGTGSNIVLQGTLLSLFGSEGTVTFLEWLVLAVPLTVINLLLLWVILVCCFIGVLGSESKARWDDTSSGDIELNAQSSPLPMAILNSNSSGNNNSEDINSNNTTNNRTVKIRNGTSSLPRKALNTANNASSSIPVKEDSNSAADDNQGPLSYAQWIVVSTMMCVCSYDIN